MTIPVLGMWQPWASLVALQEKRIETRSEKTANFMRRYIGGPIAIQATATWNAEIDATCRKEPIRSAIRSVWNIHSKRDIPLGALLCVTQLLDVCRMLQCPVGPCTLCNQTGFYLHDSHGLFNDLITPREIAFGDWQAGRYGLVLGARIEYFAVPIPIKGKQQIGWPWDWDTAIGGSYVRGEIKVDNSTVVSESLANSQLQLTLKP